MIWTVIAILIVLWLLGFSLNFGGNLIHSLIVIALIVVIVKLVS